MQSYDIEILKFKNRKHFKLTINKCLSAKYIDDKLHDIISNVDIKLFRQYIKYIVLFINYNLDDYKNRISRLLEISPALTQEKFILLYGETLGIKKWKEYCNKQSITNKFDYKSSKHGWTIEEFNTFNKSRAITLENMTLKYGEELGSSKFKEYCDKQKEAGNSLNYFQNKYGEELGSSKFKEVCSRKGLTYNTFKIKYGEECDIKWSEFIMKSKAFYSNISQEAIVKIDNILMNKFDAKSYYASKNSEFGVMDKTTKKYYKLDYVFIYNGIKICLEFNGDHWHCNPSLYSANDNTKTRGKQRQAEEVWEKDIIKAKTILSNNMKLIYLWENDYNNDKDKSINKIVSIIEEFINKG